MKIPTFLGLFILFLIIAAVIYGTSYFKNQKQSQIITSPANIEQNNISSDSITVTWQTSIPTNTELLVSNNQNMNQIIQHLKDNRDNATSQARISHISTINNLLPNTAYFIKIKISGILYPSSDTQIKTTAAIPASVNYSPIVGNVVDQNLKPVNDGLVFLLVPDAYPISTGILQDGNFILPLTLLTNKSGSNQPFDQQSLSSATLLIKKGDQKSEVTINIPNISQPLPPIVLGQNLDLRQQASSSADLQQN